jgi:hypothetical protein
MSSKKRLCILSSGAIALATLAIALVPQGLEAHASNSSASLVFGSSTSSSSAATFSKNSLTASGVTVSSVSASRAYSSGKGYSLRLGTGSYAGNVKFTFSSKITVSSITVYAWRYGSDSGSILKLATSSHTSYVSNTISSSYETSYNYAISGSFNTLTLANAAARKRVNVSELVFNLEGGEEESTSSSASHSSSSSSTYNWWDDYSSEETSSSTHSSSSSSTHSSSSTEEMGTQTQESVYRIKPVVASGSSVNVYNVSYKSGLYKGTVVKTLTKGSVYTDPEDVALYYQAWKALPVNYLHYTSSSLKSVKKKAYAAYGTSARLYTEYSRTNGYTQYFPTLNTYYYTEADIATSSSYASGPTWNRGTGRLVIVPVARSAITTGPSSRRRPTTMPISPSSITAINGFGALFNGQNGSGYGAWSQAATVTYTL